VQPDSSGKILDLMEALKASLTKTSKPDTEPGRMVS
jgi:non-homologous end joining protein Ku